MRIDSNLIVSACGKAEDQLMKILITGVTGLIGKALAIDLLKDGHEVKGVARNEKNVNFLPRSQVSAWDVGKVPIDLDFIRGVDAIVHLAGAPVMEKAWSQAYRKEILESRELGTREWAQALAKIPQGERPKVFVSGSAIGYYGDRGDEILDEASSSGRDFLAEVAMAWEKEAKVIQNLDVRVACIRTGIVLSRDGGALSQMQPVVLGNGKNWMSWIHLRDEIGIIRFLIDHPEISGEVNVCAPMPVRNRKFTEVFARVKKIPVVLSVPKMIVQTALGDRANAILSSERVLPNAVQAAGYRFQFATVEEAMEDLYPEGSLLNEVLQSAHFIAAPIEEVFPFFGEAKNLEKLTPEFVGFKILNESTVTIEKGTEIDYEIKVHGLPLQWKTLIEEWEAGKSFVDTQIKGPYQYWRHVHAFYPVPGGTLMLDHVTYRLPAGLLGKLVAGRFVNLDVKKIFSYRTEKIDEIFGGRASA